MKKGLKISGFILLGLVALILLAGVLVPVLFKDDIKKAIDTAISENVNAEVYFDTDKFGLSVFKNFPDITVTLDDFGVVGIDDFKGDTLASVSSFRIVVDIMSVINGEQMKINGIYIGDAKITAIVHKDGKANWDIAKPTTEEETPSEPFSLAIDEFVITNSSVVYDDQLGNMYASVKNLNYNASIELGQLYNLVSKGNIEALSYKMDGVSYLSDAKLDLKFDTEMDLDNMKFKFKENLFTLNDFTFGFDGSVEMPDSLTTRLDITYEAKETSFKNILSLVPGIFLEGFEELKTDGELKFNGFAKGDLVGDKIPAFELNLFVKDGMFQYPELPTAVKNVQVDLKVNNEDGIVDNTIINLKKFHMDMGTNPVDAKLVLKGLTNMNIDANVLAKINLGEISKIYPIDGMTLKGIYAIDVTAKGMYSEALKKVPVIDAKMSLTNGYVKSADFPAPLENLNLTAEAFSDGVMANSWFNLKDFKMTLDGEPFGAKAYVKNFDDINYDASFDGTINITKMLKLFPVEDMTVSGIIKIDQFNTKGKMSDIEAENYMALQSTGSVTITDLFYSDADLPQGMKITKAQADFNSNSINLNQYNGFIGKSDMQMDGKIENYMGYMFSKTDSTLRGKLNFVSQAFDLNEWMVEEEIPAGEEIPLEIIPIPQNIDFVIPSKINKLLYDNYDITNMVATIVVKDGVAKLEKGGFNMLGASFTGGGFYDTRDLTHPLYAVDFNIQNLGISEAYNTFNTIQTLAPIAKNLSGAVNTTFHLGGELGQDMMPIMKTLTGSGFVNFLNGEVKEVKAAQNINKVTGFDGFKGASLKDLLVNFKIDQGTLQTSDFPFVANGAKMVISGKSFIDGTLDYGLNMQLPSGSVGNQLKSSLSSAGLGSLPVSDGVNVLLGLTGNASDPAVKIKSAKPAGPSVKDAAKTQLTGEVDKRKAETQARLDAEKKQREDEARAKVDAEKQRAEAEAKRIADEQKKKAEEEAKKQIGTKATDAIKTVKKPW